MIAESTGKHGTGVVPIAGEAVTSPATYGTDRLFVCVRLQGSTDKDASIRALKAAGEPVAEIEWPEPSALGAEFLRWEIATAIVGAMRQVNPFDEPNVQQAKDATRTLLDRCKSERRLPVTSPDRIMSDGVALVLSELARDGLDNHGLCCGAGWCD